MPAQQTDWLVEQLPRASGEAKSQAHPQSAVLHQSRQQLFGTRQSITTPAHYDGRVVYEGELGIVIGQVCKNADEQAAQSAIFGYTCINDVTAAGTC
jgi:2-keto-4-pentenoate hydratase/2-oxohepta-3-ene-1,7-dioic acid hydratase in catechol pathway